MRKLIKISAPSVTIAVLLLASCYRDDDYKIENNNPSGFFSLDVQPATLPADGTSSASITITGLPLDILDTLNTIELSTSKGVFANGSNKISVKSAVVVDSTDHEVRIAMASLVAPLTPGDAVITATMRGFSKKDTVSYTFNAASALQILPERVYAEPSYTQGNLFRVQVKATTGKPSLGNAVSFFIQRNNGTRVGSYQQYQNSTDSNGLTYFNAFIVDTLLKGETLQVKAMSEQNPAAADSFQIFIY